MIGFFLFLIDTVSNKSGIKWILFFNNERIQGFDVSACPQAETGKGNGRNEMEEYITA